MNAVIYARFSSHTQGESSIEGQLKACCEYAKRNGINIIGEYIDRAISGTTDSRPQFLKMIVDSGKRQFETVLVYQLDRFARNRYDSATHKAKLKKNGVKVVSVRENITEDASGVLMEAVLEGMAEYYSAELSQKVKRGIALSVDKCKFIGGFVPMGYKVDENKDYIIDPVTAPMVQKCFELYAAGGTLKEIAETINDTYSGVMSGNSFNTLNRIYRNRNYIGIYTRGGREVAGGMPRIVSDELFERVQQILNKKKKAPATARAREDYLLTTKLFCGYDREMMVGTGGTSHTNIVYHYYACKNVLAKKGCKKKTVKKDYIENFILAKAREQLTDKNIELIAAAVSEISKAENNTPLIAEIKKKLKENAAAVDNLMTAIESGEHMDLLSDRITKKREEKAELEKTLAREQLEKTEVDENEAKFFLTRLREGDINDIKYKRAIIAVFVNAIYLYDDKVTIVFNASDKPVTVDYNLLEKMEEGSYNVQNRGSYMNTSAPPLGTNANPNRWFFVGETFAFSFPFENLN